MTPHKRSTLFAIVLFVGMADVGLAIGDRNDTRDKVERCISTPTALVKIGNNLLRFPLDYDPFGSAPGSESVNFEPCEHKNMVPREQPIELYRLKLDFPRHRRKDDWHKVAKDVLYFFLDSSRPSYSVSRSQLTELFDHLKRHARTRYGLRKVDGLLLYADPNYRPNNYFGFMVDPNLLLTPNGFPLIVKSCRLSAMRTGTFESRPPGCNLSYDWNDTMRVEYAYFFEDYPLGKIVEIDRQVRDFLKRHIVSTDYHSDKGTVD